jgi:hypothetical protein
MNHAYTYIIKCPNGKSYYGYRSANKVSPEDDLWKVYFTSSKRIKELREQYDDADFVASVDKTFKSAEEAHEYETKFLTENDCVHSDDWLNGSCFPVFNGNKGRKHTEASIKNMSEAHKGQVPWNKGKTGIWTEAELKKMSEAMKGKNNPNFGKNFSEKTRKKMSEAHKGLVPWMKGKKHTEKTKKKISEAQKGKKVSDDTKKKLSEIMKARWAKKKRNEENVSIEIHE